MNKSFLLLLAATVSTLVSCKKDEPAPPAPVTTTNVTATINGAQQVQPTTSTATGAFSGTYNSTDSKLTYTVTYQGFTPTSAHIHLGIPGANGPVAIPFATLTSPITGSITLTADQADKLLNNGMYVNMHSAQFSGGEIRGNIRKQ